MSLMSWYDGVDLLDSLDLLEGEASIADRVLRLPSGWVRPRN